MVNDETTKSGFNWMQTIAIRVNSTTKQVTYNPWFYALKHFGYYVKPGAKAVRYTVNGANPAKVVAFTNPNGDVILELLNTNSTAFALTAKVGNMMYKASLPPNSFNTLKIASGTAVQEKKLEKTGMSAINNARICNSNLYFTIAAGVFAQELNITLTDLQGRTMWTGNRSGSELQSAQQVFALKSAHSNLSSGTYILAVKIKNEAGVISTLEKKVAATN